MIAKSDLIILALSSTFLVAGIIRWQHNTSVVPVVTIPASSQGAEVVVLAPKEQPTATPVVTRLPARVEEVATVETIQEERLAKLAEESSRAEERLAKLAEESAAKATVALEPVDSEPTLDVAETVQISSPVKDPGTGQLGTYTVVSGDYLGWIAEEFQTTIATLKDINNLEDNNIRIGQQLKYPLPNN